MGTPASPVRAGAQTPPLPAKPPLQRKRRVPHRRRIAPLSQRFGDRAIVVYAALTVIVGGFVAASLLYREEFAGFYRDIRQWTAGAGDAQEQVVATDGDEDRADVALPLDPLSPPAPPFFNLRAPLSLSPPYVSADAVTFRNHNLEVRLAFVDGVSRDAVCVNRFLTRFPCGLMGRASIQNLIASQDLHCRAIFYAADDIRYQCFAGETDLGRHQVSAGFARSDAVGRRVLGGAEAEARTQGAGAWNGGWMLQDNAAAARRNTLIDKLDDLKEGVVPPPSAQ